MEQKNAILLLTKLHCIQETHESGADEIYMRVYCDGVLYGKYPTNNNTWKMHTDDVDSIDLEINCTYLNEVSIDIWERDKKTDDGHISNKDEHIGWIYIRREDQLNENNCGSRTVHQPGNGRGVYQLDFRVISDPIPTVRVLAVRCEEKSAGMNVDLVEAIADAAGDCAKAAGNIIKKSPRPSRKLIGNALIASSKVMKGIECIADWLGGIIEGKDDIYMKHVAESHSRSYGDSFNSEVPESRAHDGGFFPPDENVYKMDKEDEVYFEEEYGHYFRFPLDTGSVTIELKEKDPIQANIIVGSIVIDPAQIEANTNTGIGGGSPPTDENVPAIEGGTAVMDGPAVVEIANSYYGKRNGEGAVYHICYSVGFEDWCKPATTYGQGDPNDLVPEPGEFYGIISKRSGKALTVDISNVDLDGANIHQWEYCDGTETHQSFELVDEGDGYYGIISKRSRKALTVDASQMDQDNANICQWDYKHGRQAHQSFRLMDEGNGYYAIVSKRSGKALTVNFSHVNEDNANIHQWEYYNGTEAHQSFRFMPEGE